MVQVMKTKYLKSIILITYNDFLNTNIQFWVKNIEFVQEAWFWNWVINRIDISWKNDRPYLYPNLMLQECKKKVYQIILYQKITLYIRLILFIYRERNREKVKEIVGFNLWILDHLFCILTE